jgi:hypothetical protein
MRYGGGVHSHLNSDFRDEGSTGTAKPPTLTFPRQLLQAEAETPTVVATEGSALAAVAALLEGLDALRAVQRINGSVGGARARSRNLLPRYSAAVAAMTARLPTAVARMLPVAPSTTRSAPLGSGRRSRLAHDSTQRVHVLPAVRDARASWGCKTSV